MLNESYRKRYEELEERILEIVSKLNSIELKKAEFVTMNNCRR